MSLYQHLFTPMQLGPVQVRNRVVFSAHLTNYAQDNLPGDRLINYYRERAKGGVGLIITEEQSVHPADFAYEKLIHAYDRRVIPHYQRLTSAIKAEGAAVFCQLNHNGLQGFSFFNDEPLWGPSPVGDTLFREIPQEITHGQIEEVVEGYRLVAGHVRAGGFDGVELQASHSSLLRQFMSPHTNRRRDDWGGTLENRLRLTRDCLLAVREAIGPEMALGIRLCTDELQDGGLVLEEVVEIARKLEVLGVLDFINTSIGTTGKLYMVEGSMSVPSGYQSGHTAAIRQAVSIPVVGVGRINDPIMADRLLAEGVADMVGVVRAQIADPNWALKSRTEQASEIRKCIACNQYCIGLMGLNAPLSCIQNPANGMEGTWGESSFAAPPPHDHKKNALKKRVWVIGAGPAGMEAAIVAARHGHDVRLFDKAEQVGGKVNWIVKVPQRLEYGDLVRNKSSELSRYGVQPQLGREITAEEVLREAPHVVILATGAQDLPPGHIPGMQGERVKTPIQVLDDPPQTQKHTLIIDDLGGHQASSIAEFLLDGTESRGGRISFVTSAFYPGQQLGVTLDLELWHGRMGGRAIRFYPGHIVLDASADPLLMNIQDNSQFSLEDVDLIVPVNHGKSRDDLYEALKGKVPEIYRVGEALAPKDVGEAILDGHRAARQISGVAVNWQ